MKKHHNLSRNEGENTKFPGEKDIKNHGILHFLEKKVQIETKDGELFYVFPLKARGYFHGDTVEFTVTRKEKSGFLAEAEPKKLLQRTRETLLIEGRYSRGKPRFYIIDEFGGDPIDIDNFRGNLNNGDIFLARFIGEKKMEIIKRFGNRKEKEVEENIILFRHGVRTTWPQGFANLKIKETLPDDLDNKKTEDLFHIRIPKEQRLTDNSFFQIVKINSSIRYDFRTWTTITIDGSDAKDLDDAISIARFENNDFLLAVHIADVAEYVEQGDDIDREAFQRGTSIYTPGKVIPMLPEILSNDKCSLHPGTPKATLSILLRIDTNGVIKDKIIVEGIIQSRHKATYDEVWEFLNSKTEHINDWKKILNDANTLYKILFEKRKKEGKILFESSECYFDMNEKREVLGVRKRERNDAHMLIEEFMVLANEEIAKYCHDEKIPFLSRIHSMPGEEQRKILAEILEKPNIANQITPKDVRQFMDSISEEKELYRYCKLLLPKMSKASYEDKPKEHFGLALAYYAHFTSPIRRYPDLLVHRAIKLHLRKELTKERKEIFEKHMKKWGKFLSEKERKAEEVERSIDSLMMCRFMSDKVGKSFDGMISGITESNIYVELENGIEGNIFLGKGNNNHILDPIRGILKEKKTQKHYQIGEKIFIEVIEVDMKNRRIEMKRIERK